MLSQSTRFMTAFAGAAVAASSIHAQPCMPGTFNYGPMYADPEVEQLALEMNGDHGPLLVEPDRYARIAADLALIRAGVPQLGGSTHSPDWADNKLLVSYSGEGLSQEVICRNEYYEVVNVQILGAIRVAIVEFPRNVNFVALALEYRQLAGVTTANANEVLGGCPHKWRPTIAGGAEERWRWAITVREPDPGCFGCCTQVMWTIETTAQGQVIIISGPGVPECYANCDNSTMEPILTVDDFTCFINAFAQAQSLPHEQQLAHYANCDASSTPPVLTVDDFTCFINAFAQGCP